MRSIGAKLESVEAHTGPKTSLHSACARFTRALSALGALIPNPPEIDSFSRSFPRTPMRSASPARESGSFWCGSTSAMQIDHLHVEPDHHSKGLGSFVLKHVFAKADAEGKGIGVAALRGSESNDFHLKHGYQRVVQRRGQLLPSARRQCALTPSVEARPNGGPPGPGRRYAVHFRQPGPGVPPSAPPHLER